MKKHFAINTIIFVALAVLAMTNAAQPAAAPSRSGPSTQAASASDVERSVDFEFYKTRVEPIFMKKRPGLVRCYNCHAGSDAIGGGPGFTYSDFRLEKLSPGSTSWTEEQSRRNFQSASQQVVPGEPTSSRLLMHTLARDAGGDIYHVGGEQFASRNDPDWLTLAEWVRGQKVQRSPDK